MNISINEAQGPLWSPNEAGRQDPTRSQVQPESSLIGCAEPSGLHSSPILRSRHLSSSTTWRSERYFDGWCPVRTSSRYVIFSKSFKPASEYSNNVGRVFSPPSLGLKPVLISATISDWAVSTRMSMILVRAAMVVPGVGSDLVEMISSWRAALPASWTIRAARYLYYVLRHT
jgi:hypothetical protein